MGWRRFLLGPGEITEPLRSELQSGGLWLLEEQLPGSITYRHFRAPGEYSNWKREATNGAIAVTRNRLVVWVGKGKHMDLTLDHPLFRTITVASDRPDRISFGYDAALFRPDHSGTVEIRLKLPNPHRVLEFLHRHQ